MYRKGDYVVKANTGVCRVEDIVEMNLSAKERGANYYLLIPLGGARETIYIPVNSDKIPLRKMMNEEEAWDFIRSIPEMEIAWIGNEKMREQEYKTALKSNDPTALMGIIKNMYLRNQKRMAAGKKMTTTDERYFKLAEEALYTELAFAIGKKTEDMREIISETLEPMSA